MEPKQPIETGETVQVTVRHHWGEETYSVPAIRIVSVGEESLTFDLNGVPIEDGDLYRVSGYEKWYRYEVRLILPPLPPD